MKSEIAKRILDNTPQETKDKVSEYANNLVNKSKMKSEYYKVTPIDPQKLPEGKVTCWNANMKTPNLYRDSKVFFNNNEICIATHRGQIKVTHYLQLVYEEDNDVLWPNTKCMNCTKVFNINNAGCICPDCFLEQTDINQTKEEILDGLESTALKTEFPVYTKENVLHAMDLYAQQFKQPVEPQAIEVTTPDRDLAVILLQFIPEGKIDLFLDKLKEKNLRFIGSENKNVYDINQEQIIRNACAMTEGKEDNWQLPQNKGALKDMLFAKVCEAKRQDMAVILISTNEATQIAEILDKIPRR